MWLVRSDGPYRPLIDRAWRFGAAPASKSPILRIKLISGATAKHPARRNSDTAHQHSDS
jgi:hypothetical protein